MKWYVQLKVVYFQRSSDTAVLMTKIRIKAVKKKTCLQSCMDNYVHSENEHRFPYMRSGPGIFLVTVFCFSRAPLNIFKLKREYVCQLDQICNFARI